MKLRSLFLYCLMAMSVVACGSKGEGSDVPDKPDVEEPDEDLIEGRTVEEIVAMMGVGWNLGNTFDVTSVDKNEWGNPKPTKALIDAVAKQGFKTIRIPVTWDYNMKAKSPYTVEPLYMMEVESIVKAALDNDMFVILNTHHEGGWLIPDYEHKDEGKRRLVALWKQIATRFKNYDQRLIFEMLNEPRVEGGENEWNGGTPEVRECVNEFYEAVLPAIRKTGGKNNERAVMITPAAAACAPDGLNGLIIPDDDYMIISVHTYFPYNFSMDGNPATSTDKWGSESDKSAMKWELTRVANACKARGVPVVIGEWGSINRNGNTDARAAHAGYYAKTAVELGMIPVIWDDGGAYKLLNRANNIWLYSKIVDAIVEAIEE